MPFRVEREGGLALLGSCEILALFGAQHAKQALSNEAKPSGQNNLYNLVGSWGRLLRGKEQLLALPGDVSSVPSTNSCMVAHKHDSSSRKSSALAPNLGHQAHM